MGTVGDPGVYFHLDISPDDERVAVSRQTQEPGKPLQMDIWTIDLKPGGGASRVTDDPAFEADPAWSGDGRQLAFNSGRLGPWARDGACSFVRRTAAARTSTLWTPSDVIGSPDWSLDNKHIVYMDGLRFVDRADGRGPQAVNLPQEGVLHFAAVLMRLVDGTAFAQPQQVGRRGGLAGDRPGRMNAWFERLKRSPKRVDRHRGRDVGRARQTFGGQHGAARARPRSPACR